MRWIITLLIFTPLFSYAQSSVLDQYVQVGLQNNANVRTQNLRVNQQTAALNEAKGLNLPQVSFNATYSMAAGGRRLEFPVGDLLNPVYSTLNDITGQAAFPQIDNVSETFLPHNFQETKIRVQQNLFNRDIQHNYRAQEQLLNLENAKRETVAADLEKDIRMAYVQYLQANRVTDIYAAAETLVREVLRVNESLVRNGKATRDVIYDAQFELDKIAQEQATAQQNIQAARAYFNYLLQRDLNETVQIDTT
ncbi:MAG: TolC family protein, partial [Saprospiraceae bacterium]